MNIVSTDVTDETTRLKILKSLLSNTIDDGDVLRLIQDEIDEKERAAEEGVEESTPEESPEITYSTLRIGKRLYRLTNTEFSEASDELKTRIKQIGEFTFYLGLRNYLTFGDRVVNKRNAICNIIVPYTKKTYILTKFAATFPGFYSWLSNITALIMPYCLLLRRKWNYRD